MLRETKREFPGGLALTTETVVSGFPAIKIVTLYHSEKRPLTLLQVDAPISEAGREASRLGSCQFSVWSEEAHGTDRTRACGTRLDAFSNPALSTQRGPFSEDHVESGRGVSLSPGQGHSGWTLYHLLGHCRCRGSFLEGTS